LDSSNKEKGSTVCEIEGIIIDNVAHQITIKTTNLMSSLDMKSQNIVDYINSQKNNRYSSINCSPFLVHVKSLDVNIGNLHFMNLDKTLTDQFLSIIDIKRLRKKFDCDKL